MKPLQNPPPKKTKPRTAHRRQVSLPLSGREKLALFLRRTLPTAALHPDGEKLAKAAVCGVLTVLLSLLQTTVFARFRPFGAIPDLLLPMVVSIAMAEGEKWGAVCGLCAAFVIDSLGGSGFSLTPLLYASAGYFFPIITKLYLTDSIPVRLIYTAISCAGRAVATLFSLAAAYTSFDLSAILTGVILPEYASTFIMSLAVHFAVRAVLHPFHRSRAERVGTL